MTFKARNTSSLLVLAALIPAVVPLSALGSEAVQPGSWGQAWGDEDASAIPASSAPVRAPRNLVQSPVPAAPPALGPSTATPLPAPPASMPAGWGQAWGDDDLPAIGPAPSPRPAVSAPLPALGAAQTRIPPLPAQGAAPVQVAKPALDTGSWGQAWDDEQPVQPIPARVEVASRAVTAPPPAPEARTAPMGGESPLAAGRGKTTNSTGPSIHLAAEQMVHDRELGTVIARGRVDVQYEKQALSADQIIYNQRQDTVIATGNVMTIGENGDVLFTDYIQLTGTLKEGITQAIRVIMADNSVMTAEKAVRTAGDRTEFDSATYTACAPCSTDPKKQPFWQIKAEKVIHNQVDQTVEYKDAWLEVAGIPVAYTPYLSHPDPTLKRKSGFLAPSAGLSNSLGPNVTIPYYWAIADNQDLTVTSRFLFPKSSSTNPGDLSATDETVLKHLVLSGDHRWRGREGETRTMASITADKYSGDTRGHIDATGKFDLNRTWRAGYQVQRTTDDNYLAIYRFPVQYNRPWLTTRPYLEGFSRRNYALAEGFAFQGLSSRDVDSTTPVVLPHMSYRMVDQPSAKGGYLTWDSDLLAYARSVGTGAERLSSTVSWQRPFYGRMGDITTVTTSLRGDAYHADQVPDVGSANSGRVIPQMAMNWSMPFIRNGETASQVIEPLAMVAASPRGQNPDKIPDEDSLGFELDDSNIFRPNRMVGLDRVEGGIRGAYGLRWRMFPAWGGSYSMTAGQGWRAQSDSIFRSESGFSDRLSDYVARVDAIPSPNLSFHNRTRVDRETGHLRRNENTLSAGSSMLRTNLSYLMLEREGEGSTALDRRHYAAASLRAAMTRYWHVIANTAYDLTNGGDILFWSGNLVYDDECFAFMTSLREDFYNDRDLSRGFELTFHVVFKNLADVPVNAF